MWIRLAGLALLAPPGLSSVLSSILAGISGKRSGYRHRCQVPGKLAVLAQQAAQRTIKVRRFYLPWHR